jgi:hypothetical protein
MTDTPKKSELQASVSFRFKEDKIFMERLAKDEGRTLGKQLQHLLETYVYPRYPELQALRQKDSIPVNFGPGAQHAAPQPLGQQQYGTPPAQAFYQNPNTNPNYIPQPEDEYNSYGGGVPLS